MSTTSRLARFVVACARPGAEWLARRGCGRAPGTADRARGSARPADVRSGEQAVPRRPRDRRPEVHLPGERHLVVHRPGGRPLQVTECAEAERHPLPELLHRPSGLGAQGRQHRRGCAEGFGAGWGREHPGAPPAGGSDGRRLRRRPAGPDDLGAAAEHVGRRGSGGNVHARRHCRRPVHDRLPSSGGQPAETSPTTDRRGAGAVRTPPRPRRSNARSGRWGSTTHPADSPNCGSCSSTSNYGGSVKSLARSERAGLKDSAGCRFVPPRSAGCWRP